MIYSKCILFAHFFVFYESRIAVGLARHGYLKYDQFKHLYELPEAIVIPNAWDAGTSRILTSLCFDAFATTSAGLALSLDRRDSALGEFMRAAQEVKNDDTFTYADRAISGSDTAAYSRSLTPSPNEVPHVHPSQSLEPLGKVRELQSSLEGILECLPTDRYSKHVTHCSIFSAEKRSRECCFRSMNSRKNIMLNTLLSSVRIPFLILTSVSIFLGFSTTYMTSMQIHYSELVLVLLGALLADISVNKLDKYQDYRSGLDAFTTKTPFSGGSEALIENPLAVNAAFSYRLR